MRNKQGGLERETVIAELQRRYEAEMEGGRVSRDDYLFVLHDMQTKYDALGAAIRALVGALNSGAIAKPWPNADVLLGTTNAKPISYEPSPEVKKDA
jgi:hypothetical protein